MSFLCPVVLIGPMGAGKSTIGHSLSQVLNREFVDLDKEIERTSGASIPWIFDIEGESGFRKRESLALEDSLLKKSIVLATGGGCVLSEPNQLLLKSAKCVVYLKVSVAEQFRRIAQDHNRPLLQTPDPQDALLRMSKIRNPIYESLSTFTVDTEKLSLHQAVETISFFCLSREICTP